MVYVVASGVVRTHCPLESDPRHEGDWYLMLPRTAGIGIVAAQVGIDLVQSRAREKRGHNFRRMDYWSRKGFRMESRW